MISLFFWPTPAVPLVSAVLLPAAIVAGLPPLAGAMAIAIAGQGMALSSDYVIGVAPGISAKAAGAAVSAAAVADRALVLSLITGGIALLLAYLSVRKLIVPGKEALLERWQRQSSDGDLARLEAAGTFDKAEIARGTGAGMKSPSPSMPRSGTSRRSPTTARRMVEFFAISTPSAFLCVIAVMVLPKGSVAGCRSQGRRRGGAGRRLGGGADDPGDACRRRAAQVLDASADHVTEASSSRSRRWARCCRLPAFSSLARAGTRRRDPRCPRRGSRPAVRADPGHPERQIWIPHNHVMVAFGVLIIGMITGIDGSGFAGLPLQREPLGVVSVITPGISRFRFRRERSRLR